MPNTLDAMDSLNISNSQGDHPIATGRSFEDAWEYWTCFVTPDPIAHDLLEMIRLDLRKQWYPDRLQAFWFWTHANWARIDSEKILLDSNVSSIDSQRKVSFFCNRPSDILLASKYSGGCRRWKTCHTHVYLCNHFRRVVQAIWFSAKYWVWASF